MIVILLPTQSSSMMIQKTNIPEKNTIEKTSFFDIGNLIDQVTESMLYDYLEVLAVDIGGRYVGTDSCRETAEYIYDKFNDLGLYTYIDPWRFPKYQCQNVVAIQNGSDPDNDAVVLVIAHYDTICRTSECDCLNDSPGAIDDGSGVAAMLAIANIVSKYTFNHTIRFTAVSGEEVGTYGSFYDAKKAYKKDENIIAVLNIDGIGFDNISEKGNLVQIFGKDRSEWMVDFSKEISKKYESHFDIKPFYSAHYSADQESYNDYGYDAIQFVQPKPEESNGVIFHSPNDTIDKVNFTYLEQVTKLILAMTCELAIKPIDVQVRITKPNVGCIYLRNLRIKLPCFNLYASRIRALTYIIGKTTVKINLTTNEDISMVYFGIDGYLRHICNEPPYEYKIKGGGYRFFFRLKGHHRLTVDVITNTGKHAHDEMDIFVCSLI